jgi:hypothetical protein
MSSRRLQNKTVGGKMKFSKIKRAFSSAISVTVVLTMVSLGVAANAAQLSTNGASISWDESTVFYPSGCGAVRINHSVASSVLMAEVSIFNKFGDNVGSTIIFGEGIPGSQNLQVCSFDAAPSGAPFRLELEVQQSYVSGDGSSSIVSSPFTFQSRTSSTPVVTTPPSPVVTTPPSPTATTPPSASSTRTFVCVNRKSLRVTRAPSSLVCKKGTVLRSFN